MCLKLFKDWWKDPDGGLFLSLQSVVLIGGRAVLLDDLPVARDYELIVSTGHLDVLLRKYGKLEDD